MSHYTAKEKAEEARRECLMRERVYDNRIRAGTMGYDIAMRQIAIMKEIADEYAAKARAELLL